ncbi:hypothetical protein cyc_01069 [Cyclospora cayetanensis]|uniref:Uncharacterized protein n=1 Tax=Cyclospora cayetanensis TaxID=88456 RepID=A0A1D3D3D1_9EIME|nr:hypothetical protein cyc_01069 [Cyclospora cayetanensis]
MRPRAVRRALQCLAGTATTVVAGGAALLLLHRYKQRHCPSAMGPQGIPEIYGKPYEPLSEQAVSNNAELLANPSLGTPDELINCVKGGSPIELHIHLKNLFCAKLKAALLCDLATRQLQQETHAHRHGPLSDADMPLLLQEIERTFTDVFSNPEIRAAASGCDFVRPTHELIQALREIRSSTKGSTDSSECSMLPLLFTESGRDALAKFITAVDKQVLKSLCSSWVSSGSLQGLGSDKQSQQQESSSRRVRQLSALNTGKNAGTPMALASYADVAEQCKAKPRATSALELPLFLRASDVKAAKDAISKQGFIVLKNALTPKQLQELQQATFSATATAAEGGMKMKEVDPNVYCTRPTYGRLHCLLRGSLVENSIVDAQRLLMPLVHSYLPSGAHLEAGGAKKKNKLFVSEMQTVNADALALAQPWHRDNSHRGITVVIPLVHVHSSNGPTELLPGSHTLSGEDGKDSWVHWMCSLPAFFRNVLAGGTTVKAVLEPGDLLVYDSRLLHRGQANETWHPRPSLVLRYDYEDTPPPGIYKSEGFDPANRLL